MSSSPSSARDFFRDCPWLQVPQHRRADIVVHPIYPQRGLMGGTSTAGGASKLAALAAKRRQKENEKQSAGDVSVKPQDDYAASLSKLNISPLPTAQRLRVTGEKKGLFYTPDQMHEACDKPSDNSPRTTSTEENTSDDKLPRVAEVKALRASPSPFASIMLGHPDHEPAQSLTPVPLAVDTNTFDFKDPSPDDIVYKAQTPKGRPHG